MAETICAQVLRTSTLWETSHTTLEEGEGSGSTKPEVEKHSSNFQYSKTDQIKVLALQQGWDWALRCQHFG